MIKHFQLTRKFTKYISLICLVAFSFLQKNEVWAQCKPDLDPPTTFCKNGPVHVGLSSFGSIEFWAGDLDANSYDNCTPSFGLSSRMERGPVPSPIPPLTRSLAFDTTDFGLQDIVFWAVDEAGNGNPCLTQLFIEDCYFFPNLNCGFNTEVYLAGDEAAEIYPLEILNGDPYCLPAGAFFQLEVYPPSVAVPSFTFDTSHVGDNLVKVGIYQANGTLEDFCWENVKVVNCDNEDTNNLPAAVCADSLKVNLLGGNPVTVSAESLDKGSFDLCAEGEDLLLFIEASASPSSMPPTSETLTFSLGDVGMNDVILWVGDGAGNWANCHTELEVLDCDPGLVCETAITVSLWPSTNWTGSPDHFIANQGCPLGIQYELELDPPSFSNPPGSSSITLDDSDVGSHTVAVWQLADDTSYCTSILSVEDLCINSDTQPPSPYCANGLSVTMEGPTPGIANLGTFRLNAGSFDNCTSLEELMFRVEQIGNPTTSPPIETYLTFTVDDVGLNVPVALWVGDKAGNWSYCTTTVNVIEPDCTSDLTSPNPNCHVGLVVDLDANNQLTVLATDFNECSFDNCSSSGQLDFRLEKSSFPSANPPASQSLDFDETGLGMHDMVMWVIDETGNAAYCMTTLTLEWLPPCTAPSTISLPANFNPGDPFVDSLEIDVSSIGLNWVDEFFDFDCDGQTDKTIRTWTMGDWCSQHSNGVLEFPLMDTNGDGTDGDAYEVYIVGDSVYLLENGVPGIVLYERNIIYTYTQTIQYNYADTNLICNNLTNISAVPGDTTFIFADAILEGGPYCYDSMMLQLNPPSTPGPYIALDTSHVGTHTIMVEQYNNGPTGNSCWGTIEVFSTCSLLPDTLAPTAICKNSLVVEVMIPPGSTSPAFPIEIYATDLDDGSFDDCTQLADLEFQIELASSPSAMPPGTSSILLDASHAGSNEVVIWAIDEAGNAAYCLAELILNVPDCWTPYTIHIPADFYPGDPTLDTLSTTSVFGLGRAWEDEFFDYDCDGQTDLTFRTWYVYDWCAPNFNNQLELLSIDLNNDGITGDAYDVYAVNDSVYLLENGVPTTLLGERSVVYTYTQTIRYNYADSIEMHVIGQVFIDTLTNCTFDAGEIPLEGWTVKATGLVTGEIHTALTNEDGEYDVLLCSPDTLVEISLDVPFNYGQSCPTTYTLEFDGSMSETLIQDIPVFLDADCPLIHVDISTPKLKLCTPAVYNVNYCNLSTEQIEDAYVEVTLDTFLSLLSSAIPADPVGTGTWSFEVGDLEPGECGSFWIIAFLDCNATLGMTHCASVHFFPDTLCPNIVNWTGANIEVEGFCENDEVHLSIKNTGAGDMADPLEFIIVEDVIMYQLDTFELNSNDVYDLPSIPSGGATWRIEAEQEPNHPYPGSIAVAVEGCGGLNVPGLVNLFPLENPNPFIANFCLENVSSFDPNDKQAMPRGYGTEHFIEKNTAVEYLIRFQNTGTDTASKVVILDTLSQFLDPLSLRPGAASHAYQFELLDGNVVRFTFDPIALPDSNTNVEASQGFIQFSIDQKPDLPIGTVIENEAAIYFDFNDPVMTNAVFHTIGEHFIEVINDTNEQPTGLGELLTYPNPSWGDVTFEIPTNSLADATFILHDVFGQRLINQDFAGNTFRFERKNLSPGVYFYVVETAGLGRYSGKVILQ